MSVIAPSQKAESSRLALPQVTLCAATSVNVQATLRALEVSLAQIDFAACKLFTHLPLDTVHDEISVIPIGALNSTIAYSDFLIEGLVDYIESEYCLIVQWDGHVIDAGKWRSDFLDYDYIGASWPQFDDGHDVGNGGFSLRSRRLMKACRAPSFRRSGAEDVAIARTNRGWLEEQGMRFASRELADLFSTERAGNLRNSFGYHGVWNMPAVIGIDAFWQVYRDLDDIGAVSHDFAQISQAVSRGAGGHLRALRMAADYLRYKCIR